MHLKCHTVVAYLNDCICPEGAPAPGTKEAKLYVWLFVCSWTPDPILSPGVWEPVPARAEPWPPTHFI